MPCHLTASSFLFPSQLLHVTDFLPVTFTFHVHISSFLALKLSHPSSLFPLPVSSVCPLWDDGEIVSLRRLRDRQQTDESRSMGNKTDNKSQICSLILSAVGIRGQEGKERRGRRRPFTTLSFSLRLPLSEITFMLLCLGYFICIYCVLLSYYISSCFFISLILSHRSAFVHVSIFRTSKILILCF